MGDGLSRIDRPSLDHQTGVAHIDMQRRGHDRIGVDRADMMLRLAPRHFLQEPVARRDAIKPLVAG